MIQVNKKRLTLKSRGFYINKVEEFLNKNEQYVYIDTTNDKN